MGNRFNDRVNKGDAEYIKYSRKNRGFSPNVSVTSEDEESLLRTENLYNIFDKEEEERLSFQRGLFLDSDRKLFQKLLRGIKHCSVVDIGCNNGDSILERLEGLNNIDFVLGIEVNEEMVRRSLIQHKDDNIDFICVNAEADNFLDVVHECYSEEFYFDMVCVSMLLLHVKDPVKVIENARGLLKEDGILFIRDMDDGITVAYPDKKNLVQGMLDVSHKVKYCGYRHCGREILSYLRKAGFSRVKLQSMGRSTASMTERQRELLFEINFRYIKGDVEIAYGDDKNEFEDDYNFVMNNFDECKELFLSEEFFYVMGVIQFLAWK